MMSFNYGKLEYWGESIPHRPSELSYVKQIPLPNDRKPVDSRVRTRCANEVCILEYMTPSREETRKNNYDRRLDQTNNRGFVSLKQEPYKAIGDPVYLDTKRLITNALGLPSQESDSVGDKPPTPATSDQENEKPMTTYMMRRSKKQLNTLRKELDRGRSMLRNVKLGHGLFNILQDEWTKSVHIRELDEAEAKKKAMLTWLPAKGDSSSDSGSDSEEDEDCNIMKYFVKLDPPYMTSQSLEEQDHVRFRLRPDTYNGKSSLSVKGEYGVRHSSAPPATSKRRKGHLPRPYTPVHNNISQKSHHNVQVVGSDSLGGMELNKKSVEERRQREQMKYDNLFKVPKPLKEVARRVRPRPERKRSIFFPMRKTRNESTRSSISGSLSENETPPTPSAENPMAGLDDLRQENNLNEDVPRLLGVTQELEISSTRPSTRQPNAAAEESLFQLTKEELKQQELARQLEEAAKIDSAPIERLSHIKMYRASDTVKPKSSKELLEFKASCKSSKLIDKSKELKHLLEEVKEERALRLHDELDYQEKNRFNNCQNKYLAMETTSNSFHRALKTMRLHSDYMRKESEKEKNKQQDQSKYAVWFEYLISLVPEECNNLWYITSVIDKLKTFAIKYGPDNKTESSSKASELKFTRVLKLIRPWEICSPHVAAAVEFCRDRIIEMSEQDFEELFHHMFPSVERPKTAPAKPVSQKKTK